MAIKETMIVFIYDTECLKDEAGDPVEALLYFYPGWVSDSQKVALCGQLMGSSYFLKDCFFKPRILSLQTGKFILKEFGHFILAVGTDRNISDYLLHYRADLLTSLVHLYHRDLQTVCEKFTLNGQYKNITEKLYHIFETYLPILQHNGNIFHNVPKLRMPKPASTIFLDALQTLEWCQQTKGVLGGAILYHNKIVATQLNDQISKQLALTDPLHIRTTAEQLNLVDFHIPNGVQMMAVYINKMEYNQLVANSQLIQNVKVVLSQSSADNAAFTFTKRKMKREESLMFTNIPEECSTATVARAVNANDEISVDAAEVLSCVEAGKMEDHFLPLRPTKSSYIISLQRPTHLSLHFKDKSSREIFELSTCPINFDEGDSFPEYIGHTSVCVTPLTDNKILLLDNKLSICRSSEITDKCGEPIVEVFSSFDNRRRKSIKIDLDNFFQHFLPMKSYKLERRKSFTDFYDSLKRISKKLSLKKKNPIFDEGMNENYRDFAITCINFIEHGKTENECSEALNDSTDRYNSSTRSIPDPTHPVFINNGQSISRSLFEEFVEQYHEICDKNGSKNMAEISENVGEFKVIDREVKEVDDTNCNANIKNKSSSSVIAGSSFDRNLNLEKRRTSVDKKSLSLPLKPLSTGPSFQSLRSDLPLTNLCKQPTGIPLTPLMAKLSVLALSEVHNTGKLMSSNWGDEDSHDAVRLPQRRFTGINNAIFNDSPKVQDGGNYSSIPSGEEMQRVELYICGQQNMTLLLLMEHGSCGNQPIVQEMFDICVAKFPQMESSLTEMLNISIESDQSENEYSFMCIDSKWDMLQRAGAWSPIELNIVNKMHRDLKANEDITDLIIRSNDCILYGCQTGRTEIFYKEAAHQTTGIPLPSDPMSNIEVHARTRLDRDRSLVLL